VVFKPGDKVILLDFASTEDVEDKGPYCYEWNRGKTAVVLRQHRTSPTENGYTVWEVKVENSGHENYHGTYCDYVSEAAMKLVQEKKITVWPLALTEDEAKSLIVWLMTDHNIHAVERDTPDGDVFVMESEHIERLWGS
jgi:hypothetical protein